MFKKIISLVLILGMSTCLIGQYSYDDYHMGKMDGQAQGKADASFLWFVAGVGCGVFGILAAAISDGPSPTGRLMGKSSEYIQGYTEAYQKAVKGKQILYSAIGWGTWVVIYLAVLSTGY